MATKKKTEPRPAVDLRGQVDTSGYEKLNGDVVGFYDEQSPIAFKPLHVSLDDSKLDKKKVSVLLFAELTEDSDAIVDANGDHIGAQAGELVGIWFRPGMRALARHAGNQVMLVPAGEVDTGKPNAMRAYEVYSKGKASSLIPIQEDRRKESKRVRTPFDGATPSRSDDF